MDLSDRIAIETGISNKDSFKKIGKLLHRHPSTITHEIKENRTFIPGNYFLRRDCRFVRQYVQHHICGDESCEENCCRYRSVDCQKYCENMYPGHAINLKNRHTCAITVQRKGIVQKTNVFIVQSMPMQQLHEDEVKADKGFVFLMKRKLKWVN